MSRIYSNHCTRVTGVTKLSRTQFTAKQIMSISCHKSLYSLAIYQKVASDKKLMMGMTLMYSLLHPEEITKFSQLVIQTPPPAISPVNMTPTMPLQVIPAPATPQKIAEIPKQNKKIEQPITSNQTSLVLYNPQQAYPQNDNIFYFNLADISLNSMN